MIGGEEALIKDKRELEVLLEQVAAGKTSVEEAALQLREVPYDDLGFAKTDLPECHAFPL